MKLVLELDVLAPAKYLATLQSTPRVEPERKLMRAVLEDAIYCFQKYLLAADRRGKRIFYHAEKWIFDENNDYFVSFANVCETLSVDANYLRKGLLRWKASNLRRQATGHASPVRLKLYSHRATVH